MKNYSWAIALISFIISICALVTSCWMEPFHVGLESVMGVVTALMGICAAFMVGWQIFSSINVNKELENLKLTNENFKEKVKQLDDLIESQKEEITKEKEERYLMKKELNAQLWESKALSFVDMQYFASYECLAESLCLYLELQNYERINNAVRNLGVALTRAEKKLQAIESDENNEQCYDVGAFSYNRNSKVDSENWPIKRMSSNPCFQLIRKQVEALEKRRLRLNERVKKNGRIKPVWTPLTIPPMG